MLQALRQARAALEKADRARHEPIAIVGIGCRLPGGASGDIVDTRAYWDLLRAGRDAVGPVPADRWDNAAIHDPDRRAMGKTYTAHGAFIALPDQFDAEFFGISPREAARLDPQQRLLLETAWEALEDAGVAPRQSAGTDGGIFIGIGQSHYGDLQLSPDALARIDSFTGTGSLPCFASGRLSHWLGLNGPSLSVDTACSSSLVAVHLACQSLRSGETPLALAGGVHLNLAPHVSVFLSRAGALAPDGRTKAFDAAADGFGRGEGCAVLVLKRLSDAVADGDTIHALVRGSAVNHDGAGAGLTVPSESAQARVLQQALRAAQVDAGQVGYIETHGTGTELGDPIELRALGTVFGAPRAAGSPLYLGAVKSSIGHLEAAAGIAGLIKAVLVLQHGSIAPQAHFSEPNPHVPWDALPFAIARQATPWPQPDSARIAGVSAFGMSGTNAHVVLQAPPPVSPALPHAPDGHGDGSSHVLALSARSPAALQAMAAQYRAHIEAHPEQALADICASAAARSAFEHRLALVCGSRAEALAQLDAVLSESPGPSQRPPAGVAAGRAPRDRDPEGPVFMFTGQGSQHWDMGRGLAQTEPRFRAMLERCAAVLDPLLELPLMQVLHGTGPERALIDRTDFTQPALFSLQVALADLWRSRGVEPAAVFGHSLGEYAAAWTAGVFSLEDGLRMVAARGRLMHGLPGNGAMAALLTTDAAALGAWLQASGEAVVVSGFNSPRELVISGERQAVRSVLERLAAQGVAGRELAVSHAFHSPLMEPMRALFAPTAEAVAYAAPRIDMLSTVDGRWNAVAQAQYWCRQIVEPVRCSTAFEELARRGYRQFLEIGPRPVLCGLGRANLPAATPGAGPVWLASLDPGQGDARSMAQAMAQMFVQGAPLPTTPDAGPQRRVALPHYPFQRSRHWFDPPLDRPAASAAPGAQDPRPLQPLVGQRLALPFSSDIRYEKVLDAASSATLRDHRVFGTVVVAAACHLAMVLEAATRALQATRLRLADIRLPQALALVPGGDRRVQVLLEPAASAGPGAYAFRTISCRHDADPADPAAWVVHASGRLQVLAREAPSPAVDVASALPQHAAALDAYAFYGPLTDMGFGLGASYRWLQGLRMHAGRLACELSPPSGCDDMDAGIHPGLLDTCFQTLCRLWPVAPGDLQASQTLYVPFAISALELHAFPVPAQYPLQCHAASTAMDARQAASAELTPPASLRLQGRDGTPILEVAGFQFRRTGASALLGSLQQQQRDGVQGPVLELHWEPTDMPDPADPAVPRGVWIVADQGGTGEALARRLRALGHRCHLSGPGAVRLVPPGEAIDTVIDLRALDLSGAPATTPSALQSQLVQATGGVQALLAALAGATPAPRLWLATRGGQAVGNALGVAALAHGALWGLGSVLASEYAQLRPVCIDLDPAVPATSAQAIDGLARLLCADSPEDWLALRGGHCHVARLAPSAGTGAAAGTTLVRADASYLITGGFGALGLHTAEWLVDQGARCIALAGRHLPAEGSEAARRLDALRARGAQLHCRATDIGDAAQAATLFAHIDAALPLLRGVLHAAGSLHDGLLVQQNADSLASTFHPKVAGACHLHELTRERALDFFVLFSSAATLVGSRGQAGYAIANSFMDTLAQMRRAQGLPALSIAWGAWAGAGMGARLTDAQRQRWQARGFGLLQPAEGLRMLGQLLGSGAAQRAVLPINAQAQQLPPRFRALLAAAAPQKPGGSPAASPSAPPLDFLTAAPPAQRRQLLDRHVRQVIATTLGMKDPAQVEARARLFDLGFDSVLALEAAQRLGADLGLPLHDTLVFEYPTLDALQACLADLLGDLLGLSAEATPPSVFEALTEESIAALSDEQAEQILLAELRQLEANQP